jgi:hypothetical protein
MHGSTELQRTRPLCAREMHFNGYKAVITRVPLHAPRSSDGYQ